MVPATVLQSRHHHCGSLVCLLGRVAFLLQQQKQSRKLASESIARCKRRKTLRLIVFCILAAISGNLITIGAPAEEDAATAGQKWLSLVDDEKYEESWNQASSMFRHEVS